MMHQNGEKLSTKKIGKNLLRHEMRRKKIFLFLRMREVTSFCVSIMTLRGNCKEYRKNIYDDSGLNILMESSLNVTKTNFMTEKIASDTNHTFLK